MCFVWVWVFVCVCVCVCFCAGRIVLCVFRVYVCVGILLCV